ncbi:beta-galactosidase [Paenibacillus sp. WQ 127069]|uniref:beta-galactosidase n=1 Tax=Paenibacillus baimaensis TaxID=2982185 RepID=A0ABT2UP82_9BACL|nr:alpha-amylase family protein [Paenibacillus sp. WQ 127069]MCU6796450.1 beta-galactosidase [Paenibacillus sp. WQ 127069]
MTLQPLSNPHQQQKSTERSHEIHFGSVYFRKTNPPRKDWERDYAVAAEDGHTMFRHWFPWAAIEIAPGVYDWEEFDTHLDLAAKYNIDTIIAEHLLIFPEWLRTKYPHTLSETRQGFPRQSMMSVSCAVGGQYGVSLNHPEIEAEAEKFLRTLARRYRNHPGLYGYNIWNESSFHHADNLSYDPGTQQRFREWLQHKYGNIETLAKSWFRYSLTSWEDVELPRKIESYPDVYDAIDFMGDNANYWMKWRARILREEDPNHLIVAHGNGKSFSDIVTCCGDDWRAADVVDTFGYTYWYANDCNLFLAGDIIRSASKGKQFWRAEAVGDSDWKGRTANDAPQYKKDEMSEPENIRLDCLISFATGARAYLNPRFRPLLDGPLVGAYGWYGMDGSRTARSEMASSLAKWALDPNTAPLWKAKPLKGELAILLIEDSQAFCYATYGSTDQYALSLQGAYEAFLQSNIQCDVIKIDQIDDYSMLYVPYPIAISDAVMAKLQTWVEQGGCLVSEACFGYFTNLGHAKESQPNRGFSEVFGCEQQSISLGPDRWNDLSLKVEEGTLGGAIYRQSYTAQAGTATAWFDNGDAAVIDHRYGQGRTRLVGSVPGYAYKQRPTEESRQWFASLLPFADKKPLVRVDQPDMVARLCQGEDGYYLWVINLQEQQRSVTVTFDNDRVHYEQATAFYGNSVDSGVEQVITATVGGRDSTIIKLS